MDLLLVLVTQPERVGREGMRQNPPECDGGIEDIFHVSSRASWRSLSTLIWPYFRRSSSVMRSARSSIRRVVSGSTGVPSIILFITASRSARTWGSIPDVLASVLMRLLSLGRQGSQR